jgi:predicted transcriptional regulator
MRNPFKRCLLDITNSLGFYVYTGDYKKFCPTKFIEKFKWIEDNDTLKNELGNGGLTDADNQDKFNNNIKECQDEFNSWGYLMPSFWKYFICEFLPYLVSQRFKSKESKDNNEQDILDYLWKSYPKCRSIDEIKKAIKLEKDIVNILDSLCDKNLIQKLKIGNDYCLTISENRQRQEQHRNTWIVRATIMMAVTAFLQIVGWCIEHRHWLYRLFS